MAELIWVTKDAAVNPAQIGFVRYESGAFIVTLSGGATHKFHEQSLTEAGRHLFADGPADHRASSSRLSAGEEAKRPYTPGCVRISFAGFLPPARVA